MINWKNNLKYSFGEAVAVGCLASFCSDVNNLLTLFFVMAPHLFCNVSCHLYFLMTINNIVVRQRQIWNKAPYIFLNHSPNKCTVPSWSFTDTISEIGFFFFPEVKLVWQFSVWTLIHHIIKIVKAIIAMSYFARPLWRVGMHGMAFSFVCIVS